ncbi:hypothetical protein CB1_002653003 [Camelus ferus]|nr:hypothetical protein CB1_002653003 [Camelus ferus]
MSKWVLAHVKALKLCCERVCLFTKEIETINKIFYDNSSASRYNVAFSKSIFAALDRGIVLLNFIKFQQCSIFFESYAITLQGEQQQLLRRQKLLAEEHKECTFRV